MTFNHILSKFLELSIVEVDPKQHNVVFFKEGAEWLGR
jgi:hypothetical protein